MLSPEVSGAVCQSLGESACNPFYLDRRSPKAVRGSGTSDTMIRIAGAILVAFYLVGGAIMGLRQQSPRLSDDAVQCDYRISLLEDRWHAIQHFPRPTSTDSRLEKSLSTLLDQSARVCVSKSPALAQRLSKLRLEIQTYRDTSSQRARNAHS